MSDRKLSGLFADGTAPERDSAFAARVDAAIGRARWGIRLARVIAASLALALVMAFYFAGRVVVPPLAGLIGNSPDFMGVPILLVLGMLIIGLLFGTKRYFRLFAT